MSVWNWIDFQAIKTKSIWTFICAGQYGKQNKKKQK